MTDSVYVGWKKVADDLLEFRSNNLKSNENHVNKIFAENTAAFLAPVLAICPNVTIQTPTFHQCGIVQDQQGLGVFIS